MRSIDIQNENYSYKRRESLCSERTEERPSQLTVFSTTPKKMAGPLQQIAINGFFSNCFLHSFPFLPPSLSLTSLSVISASRALLLHLPPPSSHGTSMT